MKKIFTYLTVCAAVMMVFTGCKKEEEFEPAEVATNLVGDWQGHIQEFKRYGDTGNTYNPNRGRKWVVMRFNKTTDTEGTGYQLEFNNEFMNNTPGADDMSRFNWKVREGRIEITYLTSGWDEVYMTYDKKSRDNINGSVFKGEFMTYSGQYKFVFDYSKKTFTGWDTYFK